jgi:hypothetical protein
MITVYNISPENTEQEMKVHDTNLNWCLRFVERSCTAVLVVNRLEENSSYIKIADVGEQSVV